MKGDSVAGDKVCLKVCFSPGLFQDVLTTGDFIVVLVDILARHTTHLHGGRERSGGNHPCRHSWKRRDDSSPKDSWSPPKRTASNSTSRTSEFGIQLHQRCDRWEDTRLLHDQRYASAPDGEERQQHRDRSFRHISAVTELARGQQKNVVILCSGWKNKFCLEDTPVCRGNDAKDC